MPAHSFLLEPSMVLKTKKSKSAKEFSSADLDQSATDQLDQVIASLKVKRQSWAQLPISASIKIIDEILETLPDTEPQWMESGLALTGGQPGSLSASEVWFNLSVIYRNLRFLRRSIARLETGETPYPADRLKQSIHGYLEAPVLPDSLADSILLPGVKASIWLDPSQTSQASAYREPDPKGSLCLVFAGGNAAALIGIDALHKLFVERQVVLGKTNPVNENLIPAYRQAFDPLIRRGYLEIIPGDVAEGKYLAHHPDVDELHITGSDRTYEAITFGSGEIGQRNKANKKPIIKKRFTAELGNISPVIIVPGPWSESDLKYQSRKLGSWLIPNAGHNCLTPRVLIQHQDWSQRNQLNESIAAFLDSNDTRDAYYPGSQQLFDDFTEAHPEARQLGRQQQGFLPWTFITDLDSSNREEICFTREPFIGLLSETAIEAPSIPDYIRAAVKFANENLWGTLTASIVVHPKSLKDPAIAQAVEEAIRDLDYGSVTVNHWGALAYFSITPWGSAPGRDIYDIQSGIDWVNNPYMFDAPIKSVIRAPFRQIPDPFMVDAKNSYPYFVRDTRYQADPSLPNLMRLLWAALRS
jgi:hypothetical protein